MGLDLVEFVMRVEEVFGISIPDQDAQHLRTPGKLKEYIHGRVTQEQAGTCLTQRGFYRLREALRTELDVPRSHIVPRSRWDELFPARRSRRRKWKELETSIGMTLPILVRPTWLIVSGLVPSSLLAGATLFYWKGPVGDSLRLAVVVCVLAGISFAVLTRPLRWSFARADSVGAAARFIAATAPRRLMSDREGWTRENVSDVVDGLIVEQFGIDPADFNDDSDFIEDMRID